MPESSGKLLRRLASLRKTFNFQHLRYILPIHEDIGHEAIIDISSTRDDADWSVAKQFLQPQPGCLSARFVQFRRVDASESDALGPIAKGVTIDHIDLPTVDRALGATERCGGLSAEQRSEASAIGSVHPFRFFVRVESFFTMRSVGMNRTPGLWLRLPAKIAWGARGGGGIGR